MSHNDAKRRPRLSANGKKGRTVSLTAVASTLTHAGSGSILAFDIPARAPRGKLKARTVIDGKLKAPSGFAIGPDGDVYVAERLKQRVRRFSMAGKKKGTFIDRLPDMPEFLLHVPDSA